MRLHRLFISLIIILFFVNHSFASDNKAKDFSLKDYNGIEHTLSSYSDSKAVVIMFIATKCPVSNAYNERMAALYNNFYEKGITFIGINSNKAEDAEEVKKHAAENGLEFTILKDPNNVIADEFNANHTPEVYVINGNLDIVYHGRIDDSRDENKVEVKDLSNALNDIIAGKEIAVKETKAFGCSIKRIEK